MKSILYSLLPLLLLTISCTRSKNTVNYIVASQPIDCTGVGPQKCLLVKKGNATEWEYFYSSIEGFNYEPGFEYHLEVKEERLENVPADASSIKYILIREISKVKKDSENLPAVIVQNQINYQYTGRVLSVDSENIGRGAAEDRFPVTVVKVAVTSSNVDGINEGDVIYCELVPFLRIDPVIVGNEYAFKAKNFHPAHAKGVYMLETDIMDLV